MPKCKRKNISTNLEENDSPIENRQRTSHNMQTNMAKKQTK